MNEFSNVRDSYFKLKVMYKNTHFEDNRKKILRPIIAYSAKNYHTFGRIRVVHWLFAILTVFQQVI